MDWLRNLLLSIALAGLAACSSASTNVLGWPGINDTARVNFSAAYDSVFLLNEYRRSVGVQTVDLDYDLSRGCQLHANYLEQNSLSLNSIGLQAHTEDADNPFYTPEGGICCGIQHYLRGCYSD